MSKTYKTDVVSVVRAVLVDFVFTPIVDVVEGVIEANPAFTVFTSSESPLQKYNLFSIMTYFIKTILF